MPRRTRVSTAASPSPASKTLIDGGVGFKACTSSMTRSPTLHFSDVVVQKTRYFSRESKKRIAAGAAGVGVGVGDVVVAGTVPEVEVKFRADTGRMERRVAAMDLRAQWKNSIGWSVASPCGAWCLAFWNKAGQEQLVTQNYLLFMTFDVYN